MYQFTASEACLHPKLEQDLSSCTYKAGALSADGKHIVDFGSGERLPVLSRPVMDLLGVCRAFPCVAFRACAVTAPSKLASLSVNAGQPWIVASLCKLTNVSCTLLLLLLLLILLLMSGLQHASISPVIGQTR